MKTKNILFLDFDGPLFSDRVIDHHPENCLSNTKMRKYINTVKDNGDTFGAKCITYWKMDAVAVGMLNKLMKSKPFETVVSSTWRELFGRLSIEELFRINKLNLVLHDEQWCTPLGEAHMGRRSGDRLQQIWEWIEGRKDEINNYVILDDPMSGGSLSSDGMVESAGLEVRRVILVDPLIGIEQWHYNRLNLLLT
jgi:hypothetical protein